MTFGRRSARILLVYLSSWTLLIRLTASRSDWVGTCLVLVCIRLYARLLRRLMLSTIVRLYFSGLRLSRHGVRCVWMVVRVSVEVKIDVLVFLWYLSILIIIFEATLVLVRLIWLAS